MRLFKAIQERHFLHLQNGEYPYKEVNVFCGFDRYQDSVQAVLEISQAVAFEYPDVKIDNMTVWKISREESNRHASMMTVVVRIPTETVLANLSGYTIL